VSNVANVSRIDPSPGVPDGYPSARRPPSDDVPYGALSARPPPSLRGWAVTGTLP